LNYLIRIGPFLQGGLVKRFILLAVVLAGCGKIPPSPTSPTMTPTTAAEPSVINIVVSPAELPIEGGTALITFEVLARYTGVPNARVALSVTDGTLAATELTTDTTGHAKTEWTGSRTASLTATLGELSRTVTVRVLEPIALPPPSQKPPPQPSPSPDTQPLPPPPPSPTVRLDAPAVVAAGTKIEFTARVVSGLLPGEVVRAYSWDWDSTGSIDAITPDGSATHAFTTFGTYRVTVVVSTSSGRTASASAQVIVTGG
jgi:hypothetical protein